MAVIGLRPNNEGIFYAVLEGIQEEFHIIETDVIRWELQTNEASGKRLERVCTRLMELFKRYHLKNLCLRRYETMSKGNSEAVITAHYLEAVSLLTAEKVGIEIMKPMPTITVTSQLVKFFKISTQNKDEKKKQLELLVTQTIFKNQKFNAHYQKALEIAFLGLS